MTDGPRALEPKRVEDAKRVRHVRLDRVRGRRFRGRRAALGVTHGLEEPVEQTGALAEVVGDRRAAVK
jgi:hypothetical protein